MEIKHIIKRDDSKEAFDANKITEAIFKAMTSANHGDHSDAQRMSASVCEIIEERSERISNYAPSIEEVQDIVEHRLMDSEFLDVAKAYILYRNEQAQKRKRNIFEKRLNLKPYEYPELYEYVSAIRHSYWIHSEFNFTSDIQDFKAKLSDRDAL